MKTPETIVSTTAKHSNLLALRPHLKIRCKTQSTSHAGNPTTSIFPQEEPDTGHGKENVHGHVCLNLLTPTSEHVCVRMCMWACVPVVQYWICDVLLLGSEGLVWWPLFSQIRSPH